MSPSAREVRAVVSEMTGETAGIVCWDGSDLWVAVGIDFYSCSADEHGLWAIKRIQPTRTIWQQVAPGSDHPLSDLPDAALPRPDLRLALRSYRMDFDTGLYTYFFSSNYGQVTVTEETDEDTTSPPGGIRGEPIDADSVTYRWDFHESVADFPMHSPLQASRQTRRRGLRRILRGRP